ncbi:MAG: ABC transporter ATP-binding protein [Longimicrobiales bacterium]
MPEARLGIHEEEALGKAYDARLMRRLLRYVRPYRGRVGLAVAALIAASALELVGPWLTKVAIDRAIATADYGLLGLLAAAYVGALVFGLAMEFAQSLLTTWLGQRVMYDLRDEIFRHLQTLSLPFFDRNPVGRLMTRVTSDVEQLNEMFSSGVVSVFGDLFTLIFIIIAMLLMDWQLALVTFAVLPFVFLAAFFFRSRIRNAWRDIRVRIARLNAHLQEWLTGISVIRLFNRERETYEHFERLDRDYLLAYLRSIRYYALFFPIIEFLTAVALALIIGYGGIDALRGGVTVGVIAAFLQYARRFFRPIQDLSDKYNMLQGAMASSERIFTLLDTPPGIAPPSSPRRLPRPGRGELEFRDVWFAYQREPELPGRAATPSPAAAAVAAPWSWVLRGISFRIRPGERVAIVGHTGAGKTSLISLLMRFYDAQRGQILFDGIPIDQADPAELRGRIGLVLQDVFLFSRSIGYNIRLGRTDIDDARMMAAAERVGADRIVRRLDDGFEHALGERGASLSVGERQLLSFARALAFDPQVLVLDEATSSVDSALETQIERALDTLMRGRTSLVIAHRLSTVQHADRILVLHHGELREAGTHEELLASGGLYTRLHELQFAPPTRAAG